MHNLIFFAQADPVSTGASELAKLAISGGPVGLLALAVAGLIYELKRRDMASIAQLGAKDVVIQAKDAEIKTLNAQAVASEREHSKAVAEVLKDSSKTLQDIRDMLRAGGAPK